MSSTEKCDKLTRFDRQFQASCALKAISCVSELLASIADRGGDLHMVDPDGFSLLLSHLVEDIRPALED